VPCWFGWEVRRLPGFDADALDARFRKLANACAAEMQRAAPETGIAVTITNQVPAFQADTASGIVPLTLKLARQNDTFAVCYATEASLFQLGGAPAIVCGPGNIAQAHTPDEFIRVEELEKCLAFLGRVADWARA
jgi:acetylornithine deacetylase